MIPMRQIRAIRGCETGISVMKCPTCSKETEYAGNPYRPFCSERCRLIDLGRWAGGHYRLPDNEESPEAPTPADGSCEEEE